MKLGDLVRYENEFWVVRRYDPKRTLTATLLHREGRTLEIPLATEVEVLANPGLEWPFIVVKDNPRGVRMVRMMRVRHHTPMELETPLEWLPSDPSRPGGAVFLNPVLHLQKAETLIVVWEQGVSSTVKVPANFATARVRQARAEAARQKPTPAVVYDRLLQNKFGEDE